MNFFSVVISGASRGLGLAFVKQLVILKTPPKYIFAGYKDENESLEELKILQNSLKSSTQLHLLKMDVTKIDEMQAAAKFIENIVKEEGLTLLINNAGVLIINQFPHITKENLESSFSVNAAGPFLLSQYMYPLLKQSAKRRNNMNICFSRAGIINISSGIGSIECTDDSVAKYLTFSSYKISKAALNMGTKIISTHSIKDNIITVMICPGWMKTEMGGKDASFDPEDSAATILHTATKLKSKHNGMFLDRDGDPIPF